MKRVQLIRGTTSEMNALTLREGEIAVDNTLKELRVGDSVTPGGIPVARADVANVAVATAGNAGKMSAAQAAELSAATAGVADNAADIAVNTAAITALDAATVSALASKQPLDATLTALAAVVIAANKLIYGTGTDTFSTADLTAFARTILDDADAATVRATLGLIIGTNVQAYDVELTALAGLTSAADRLPYFTGSGAAALATFTAAARSLLDDVDVSAMRTTLGLGSIATQSAANISITGGAVAGITDLAIADGGTGASTAANAFANLKQAASETATGVVELATSTETITGTDITRAVTPAGLQAKVASTTARGIVELATGAETITGSSTTLAVTPDGLSEVRGVTYNPYSGTLDFSSYTEATWVSVGPTGAGMTNTWTALNSVPAGAHWIRVRLVMTASIAGGTAGNAYHLNAYGRPQGGGQSPDASNNLITLTGQANAAGTLSAQGSDQREILINTGNRSFEIYWSATGAFIPTTVSLYLVGWGYNGG